MIAKKKIKSNILIFLKLIFVAAHFSLKTNRFCNLNLKKFNLNAIDILITFRKCQSLEEQLQVFSTELEELF
jgi:hypothetical protein